MASSKVQIANIALTTYLGKGRINALDEQNPTALMCSIHFDDARQEVLSEWPWSFATRRGVLARLTDDANDKPEWRSKFAKPARLLRINWVNDPVCAKNAMTDREVFDPPRIVEGDFIYSDLDDASIEYVEDVDDPTAYPPKFTQALAANLASKIAIPLTETASKASDALAAYAQMLDEAKVQDLRLDPPIVVRKTYDWMKAR